MDLSALRDLAGWFEVFLQNQGGSSWREISCPPARRGISRTDGAVGGVVADDSESGAAGGAGGAVADGSGSVESVGGAVGGVA